MAVQTGNHPSLRERPYDVFLSHAHVEADASQRIFQWLEKAGVKVWFDGEAIRRGQPLVKQLEQGIQGARGLLVMLSHAALRSGWIEQEINGALQERSMHRNFKVIVLRIDDCQVPMFLANYPWIEAPGGVLSADDAVTLLLSLEYDQPTVEHPHARDVYFASSWQDAEAASPRVVSGLIEGSGFRLVGDSRDQHGFIGGDRVRQMLASCGGCVGVVPHRGSGKTSEYILHEIELAVREELPALAVVEEGVECALPTEAIVVRMPRPQAALDERVRQELRKAIDGFAERWNHPRTPHFVFYAKEFTDGPDTMERAIARLVRGITGMPCMFGDDIREGDIPSAIVRSIQGSFLMICDISGSKLNTCIEAGIALGSNRSPFLIMKGKRASKNIPFMFRSRQVWFYQDELELIGLLRRLIRPFRRRIIESCQFG